MRTYMSLGAAIAGAALFAVLASSQPSFAFDYATKAKPVAGVVENSVVYYAGAAPTAINGFDFGKNAGFVAAWRDFSFDGIAGKFVVIQKLDFDIVAKYFDRAFVSYTWGGVGLKQTAFYTGPDGVYRHWHSGYVNGVVNAMLDPGSGTGGVKNGVSIWTTVLPFTVAANNVKTSTDVIGVGIAIVPTEKDFTVDRRRRTEL